MNMDIVERDFKQMFRFYLRRSDYVNNPFEWPIESVEIVSVDKMSQQILFRVRFTNT